MTDTTTKKASNKAKTAATETTSPRVASTISAIRVDIPVPTHRSARGSKSIYPFDDLPVNGSFGVHGRTAKQMASIVSNANRAAKNQQPKKDENGNVIFKTREVKDATTGVISHENTNEFVTENIKNFFAVDVNPAEDADGASVRIFRDK